jgi:hypothetical protein
VHGGRRLYYRCNSGCRRWLFDLLKELFVGTPGNTNESAHVSEGVRGARVIGVVIGENSVAAGGPTLRGSSERGVDSGKPHEGGSLQRQPQSHTRLGREAQETETSAVRGRGSLKSAPDIIDWAKQTSAGFVARRVGRFPLALLRAFCCREVNREDPRDSGPLLPSGRGLVQRSLGCQQALPR